MSVENNPRNKTVAAPVPLKLDNPKTHSCSARFFVNLSNWRNDAIYQNTGTLKKCAVKFAAEAGYALSTVIAFIETVFRTAHLLILAIVEKCKSDDAKQDFKKNWLEPANFKATSALAALIGSMVCLYHNIALTYINEDKKTDNAMRNTITFVSKIVCCCRTNSPQTGPDSDDSREIE